MKILNKFIWSKKEPSNKNDIWFDGSTWRMYTEEAWQSFTLPVDAADKVAKVIENASEVYQEKLNAGYGIVIEGNTISLDMSSIDIDTTHNIGSIELFNQLIIDRSHYSLNEEDINAISEGKLITTTNKFNTKIPITTINHMTQADEVVGYYLVFYVDQLLYRMYIDTSPCSIIGGLSIKENLSNKWLSTNDYTNEDKEKLYEVKQTTEELEQQLTELSEEIGKVAPKVAPFLETKATSLSAGQSLTLAAPNSYNHHVIGFSAELGSGILTLSHGSLQYSFGRVAVDDTYIYEYSYGSGNATKATKHGISLAPFFICTIEKGDNPYYAQLTLTTPRESFTMQINWRGSSENVILTATGQHKNVSLYFSGEGYKMPIWIYADSYASYWYPKAYDARQTGMYVDAYSGRKSATALESLREGLKLGTPRAVVWAMGMNDADTSAINADYKSALDEVLSICEERHIKVVPVTIPNTPTQLHTFKNAYIKSLGIEYIDAAQTLGASEAGASWYDGLLSADNVHPTDNGAKIYFRMLTECLGTLASKQKLLGVTTKSNGNIIVEGLADTPIEFMKATPSGSPLHDAYILGGAKWNDTDEDVMVTAPWKSLVDTSEEENITHKARRWYYNGIGDLTNDDMAEIWGRGHYSLAENGALAYYGTNAVRTTRERTGMQSNTSTFAYLAGYNDTIEVITLSIYAVLANSQNAPVTFSSNNPNGLFVRCGKLRHIFGQVTINTPVSGTFQGCKELRTLSLKGLKSNVTFADSPYLTAGSVAYMINNEASTGAITITLHATAYTRAMASEAVQTALASHTNVSLVSA